eukprot:3473284-Amphidinium_carterae.1
MELETTSWAILFSWIESAAGTEVHCEAYQRYWEGAKLLRMVRGQWMNAASCVVVTCAALR